MLELVCDSREIKIKDLIENLLESNKDISITFKNLDLGDFIFYNNEQLILIVERKTTCDLYSSIRDGRYKEQKCRLLNNYDKSKILYIIEGSINNNTKYYKNFNGITKGAILNMIFRDKLNVLRTDTVSETCEILISICKKIIKNPEFFSKELSTTPSINYENTIKVCKKDNMTPEMCSIIQLSQIPGVSTKIAKILIEKYGSLYNLIKNYQNENTDEENSKLLTDIIVSNENDKKRKLGPKLSERIFKYLIYSI